MRRVGPGPPTALRLVGSAVTGYVAGTLPSAAIAARLATGGRTDLRVTGSGNPGAANAMAVLGTGWGLGVLGADVAKAAVACCTGRLLADGPGSHLAGVAAVAGHCFPWNASFKGGKGVAASAGQCLVTFPAYFPIDVAVAALTGAVPAWRNRAFATTAVASVTWVGAAFVWWRRGWPNLWGPRPSAGLPLAAAATSAMIGYRFASASGPTDRGRGVPR